MQREDLDNEILRLLQSDSRMSYREIAKTLDVSHVNVSSRIKALEEQGRIIGYTAIVNPDAMHHYPLCLRISAESGADLSEIGRRVADYDEIQVVVRVSGECELLALAMCEDRECAIRLLDEIGAIQGIDKAESHIVLETIKLGGKKLRP
ncbi:Lrp/AsnC family transcriptional regulator [Candidatus Bathyarchaeota archaeon]|nr:Lrp/AsnC family transcriptional regulator [Candidatus Bathyarchaeota archaeon]